MAEEEIEDTLEIFDLSAEVDLTELDDEGLLFRESIIKTFYEIATRTGKAVYGFTKDELQGMANEIIEEFRIRGRDYQVPLDRSSIIKEEEITRNISMKELAKELVYELKQLGGKDE